MTEPTLRPGFWAVYRGKFMERLWFTDYLTLDGERIQSIHVDRTEAREWCRDEARRDRRRFTGPDRRGVPSV